MESGFFNRLYILLPILLVVLALQSSHCQWFFDGMGNYGPSLSVGSGGTSNSVMMSQGGNGYPLLIPTTL
uniref:Uncharacterized protein n=1 Tax=Ditylenchus dipsaci TaxID=166011 RepID=A0A915EIZ7_9BILA